ncbi:MAG TPA: aldose 1-epimerase family protein, partial [Mycobacteriales bacterium]|nr:aldose 1-epimerase family protein [Mycobacteriales bacterium]
MSESPTGRQHELRRGDHTAVVVELGGALRHYTAGDRPILDGVGAGEQITGGRGQLLVPWPNRVRDGRYRWDGRDLQLPLAEPEAGNAIHGLLRWTSWQLLDRDEHRVVVGATVWPQPGYPFHLGVSAEYELGDDGLSIAVTARNVGERAAPYGVGQHPYLTVGTDRVDDAVLTVPAQTWLRTDDRGTPLATEPVAGSAYDFRSGRTIGPQLLDTAFAELDRDGSGRAVVRLAHPSGRHGTDVWLGEGADFVQVYTGDTLAELDRRRRGVAVEPMSCPPDALRNGT